MACPHAKSHPNGCWERQSPRGHIIMGPGCGSLPHQEPVLPNHLVQASLSCFRLEESSFVFAGSWWVAWHLANPTVISTLQGEGPGPSHCSTVWVRAGELFYPAEERRVWPGVSGEGGAEVSSPKVLLALEEKGPGGQPRGRAQA